MGAFAECVEYTHSLAALRGGQHGGMGHIKLGLAYPFLLTKNILLPGYVGDIL